MQQYKEEIKEFVALLLKDPPRRKLNFDMDYIFTWSLDTRTTLELLAVFKKFIDGEVDYEDDKFSDNSIITIGLFRDVIKRDIIPNESWTYSFIPCNGTDIIFIIYIIYGVLYGLLDAGIPVISDRKKLEVFVTRIFKSFMPREKYEKIMGSFENRQKENHLCECEDCQWIRENY